MSVPRLPWQPHPEGGFIAYPEGWREQPGRYARLLPHTARTGAWRWAIQYDGTRDSGIEDGKQEASDAANRAWPYAVEKAERAAARAEWESHTLEMIAKAERGEIDPSYFADKAAEYENLMWVMDQIRHRPRTAGLLRLIDTLSREFFKRRTKTNQ